MALNVQLKQYGSLWKPSMSKNRLSKLQLVRPADGSAPERTPGKVTHDSRGNAIWDWDIATGVLARKSVTELLTSLDSSSELSLDGEPDRAQDWAGDPYNRTVR